MSVSAERVYRFAPRDRAGWILGLDGAQCLTLAAGLVLTAASVSAGAPVGFGFVPVTCAGLLAFARWRGRPLLAWIPVRVAWAVLGARRERQWTATIPLLDANGGGARVALPPFLDGLEVIEASAPWTRRLRLGNVGIVVDRRERLMTGVLRVHGREFSLLERSDQDQLLAGWGDALAAFCRERSAIARVAWSEWAAPADIDAHLQFAESEGGDLTDPSARLEYEALLDGARPLTTRHETLLTVTLDLHRTRVPRREARALDDMFADLLLEELRLLSARIEDVPLTVDVPLSPGELRETLRSRLDPTILTGIATRARAGFAGPLVSDHNLGPLTVDVAMTDVRVDRSLHRAYWIAEWPRLELRPAWMEPLLLHAGAVRTISVVFEPVPPSRSQRRVDRDATRLASDEEQRAKRGFRVGARHRRAEDAVLEREQELVAGYSELEFAGFVEVCAADPELLEAACAEYEQAAAQVGLELRPLDAQHDAGVGACLPIGRYPTARRFT